MDEIRIKQLEVFAHHGVFPEENRLGQKFVVSAVLYTDLRRAGLTDDLNHSMDYGAVCAEIQHYLTAHTFQLLETAAERLCMHLLRTLPLLRRDPAGWARCARIQSLQSARRLRHGLTGYMAV